VNAEHFQKLDRLIHEKARMGIMSLLAATPELSFTEIRDQLRLTDGNLSIQIKTLQEAGYVAVTKSFHQKRPRTTCALTATGRRAFQAYLDTLEKIIEQSR
jgi:DNA-binding MarR family transcriptional regulator